ncbi:hypothetical protein [Vibrio phage Va2]|nr:hypothetical protein [Vibrio phage Va2]
MTDAKENEQNETNPLEGIENMNGIDAVGHDIGFGDNKVVAGTISKGITQLFKFPSAVAPVQQTEHFQDSRVISMGDQTYYVGDDAMRVESAMIQDVVEYKHLEAFLPLFLHYVMRRIGCNDKNQPKVYVLGLSVAHIQNSGYFKEAAEKYFKALGWDTKVVVLPQGAGVKVAHDHYGTNFPQQPEQFIGSTSNFLIADMGFNTLDVLHVLNGKVTPTNVRGIPDKGAVVLAARLANHIKKTYGREYSVKEVKEFLDQGHMSIRGTVIQLRDVIEQFKREYLQLLEVIMEKEFGKIMDKVSYVLLAGGGAYFFSQTVEKDQFYHAPKSHSEYYNAIGYFEKGRTDLLK